MDCEHLWGMLLTCQERRLIQEGVTAMLRELDADMSESSYVDDSLLEGRAILKALLHKFVNATPSTVVEAKGVIARTVSVLN